MTFDVQGFVGRGVVNMSFEEILRRTRKILNNGDAQSCGGWALESREGSCSGQISARERGIVDYPLRKEHQS